MFLRRSLRRCDRTRSAKAHSFFPLLATQLLWINLARSSPADRREPARTSDSASSGFNMPKMQSLATAKPTVHQRRMRTRLRPKRTHVHGSRSRVRCTPRCVRATLARLSGRHDRLRPGLPDQRVSVSRSHVQRGKRCAGPAGRLSLLNMSLGRRTIMPPALPASGAP